MSDFKAKMYQSQFRRWGAYSAPPDPLAGIRGPTSKGMGGDEKGRGGKARGGKGGRMEREGEGREGVGTGRGEEAWGGEGTRPHLVAPPPNPYFWIRPWLSPILRIRLRLSDLPLSLILS